jgi:cytochrome P450
LNSYQPRIERQTDELIKQLSARKGQPLDVTMWSMFFSFDTMGDINFSRDFGNMTTGQEHPALRQMHGYLWLFGLIQAIPWLPNLLTSVPGANRGIARFENFCKDVLVEKQKVSGLWDVISGAVVDDR